MALLRIVSNNSMETIQLNTKVQESRRANNIAWQFWFQSESEISIMRVFERPEELCSGSQFTQTSLSMRKAQKRRKNLANSPNRLPANVKSPSVEKEEKRKVKSSTHPQKLCVCAFANVTGKNCFHAHINSASTNLLQ